jgi:hypothetical protein
VDIIRGTLEERDVVRRLRSEDVGLGSLVDASHDIRIEVAKGAQLDLVFALQRQNVQSASS